MSIVESFKALADESRVRILHALSHGNFNVQELTSVLGLSQPTISHHLKILQQVGLARPRREGTWVYYSFDNSARAETAPFVRSMLDLALKTDSSAYLPSLQSDRETINSLLDKRRDNSRSYFEAVAPEWSQIREEAQGSESFLDLLAGGLPDNCTLLELGCGSGALLEKILPRKGKTIGVDYSQAMLNEARKNVGRFKSDVDLRLGYLEHLPIGDESVDVAVAYMVLHHLANPLDALQDVSRALRSGGELHIVDWLPHQKEFMRERYADLWLGFAEDEFASWLKEAGFVDFEISVLGEKKEVFLSKCRKP